METNIAWAAGLFEGEGYITFHNKNSIRLGLEMTDKDIIEKFHLYVKCGTVTGPKIREGCKPLWIWCIYEAHKASDLIYQFLPYFGERRTLRSLEALERIKNIRTRKVVVCGTSSGARKHYKTGEKPCEPCRLAWNLNNTERRNINGTGN